MLTGLANRRLRPLGYLVETGTMRTSHSARRREWSRPRELSPPERLGRAPPNHSARPACHGGVPGLRTPYAKDAGFTVQCSHPCCSHSRCMAPRTRFERATPGFVGQCSDPVELTREGKWLMRLEDAERVERLCRRSRPSVFETALRPLRHAPMGGLEKKRGFEHRCRIAATITFQRATFQVHIGTGAVPRCRASPSCASNRRFHRVSLDCIVWRSVRELNPCFLLDREALWPLS